MIIQTNDKLCDYIMKNDGTYNVVYYSAACPRILYVEDTYKGKKVTTFTIDLYSDWNTEKLRLGDNIKNIVVKFNNEDLNVISKLDSIYVPESLEQLPDELFFRPFANLNSFLINCKNKNYALIRGGLVDLRSKTLLKCHPSMPEVADSKYIENIAKFAFRTIIPQEVNVYIGKHIKNIPINILRRMNILGVDVENENYYIDKKYSALIKRDSKMLIKFVDGEDKKFENNICDLSNLDVETLFDNIFKNNKTVEKIILPKNLKAIGRDVFCGCENLKEVVFPDNEIYFSRTFGQFASCINLKNIKYPRIKNKDAINSGIDYCENTILPSNLGKRKDLVLCLPNTHYDRIDIYNVESNLTLYDSFNPFENDSIVIDKLVFHCNIDKLNVECVIKINDIEIDSENSTMMIDDGSLVNEKGELIYCIIPDESTVFRLSKKVKSIENLECRISSNTNFSNLNLLVIPDTVEKLSFTVPTGLPKINNIMILNPNIDIFNKFGQYFKYINFNCSNIIINISKSTLYEVIGNTLVRKDTHQCILNLEKDFVSFTPDCYESAKRMVDKKEVDIVGETVLF